MEKQTKITPIGDCIAKAFNEGSIASRSFSKAIEYIYTKCIEEDKKQFGGKCLTCKCKSNV